MAVDIDRVGKTMVTWSSSAISQLRAVWAAAERAPFEKRGVCCLRVSRGLSWNNPARLQLLELAERLERQAKEFELQNHPAEKVA
jgi:hypothetical protein